MSFLMNSYRPREDENSISKIKSTIITNNIRNIFINFSNLKELFEGITSEALNDISGKIAELYIKELNTEKFNYDNFTKFICDYHPQITTIIASNEIVSSLHQDENLRSIGLICQKIIPNITEQQKKELYRNLSVNIITNYTTLNMAEENNINIIIGTPNQKAMEQMVQDTAAKINGIKIELPTRGRKAGSKNMEKSELPTKVKVEKVNNSKESLKTGNSKQSHVQKIKAPKEKSKSVVKGH